MMQVDFEEILGKKVTESDFRMIEVVYMWHPSNLSKEAVAELYKKFGMALIKDMMPRADKMKELEEKKRKAQGDVKTLSDLIDAVKRGEELNLIERYERGMKDGEV